MPSFGLSPVAGRSANHPWTGLLLGALILIFASACAAKTQEYGKQVWDAAGTEIVVYTYRPASCESHDILLVFHGLNRKAESLRDKATRLAKKACLMVFAPLFDKDRFPNWRYHRAGVVRDGQIQPKPRWTESIFRELLRLAKIETGRSAARTYLFGHSAGGQFLSRISAYSAPFNADRIVIANPSVHVAPNLTAAVPYGFGGLVEGAQGQARIKRYLELPISIYLGQEDTKSKNLVVTDAANKQGDNRLNRGRNIFQQARQLADEKGWKFNWRLVEANGVGHSSGGMLRAEEMLDALARGQGESRD